MTKESIIHEALYLFSQKGYSGASIRDIASAVGIKESSIYAHFTSKEDIFRNVIASYDFLQSLIGDLDEYRENSFEVINMKINSFIGYYKNPDYIAYSKLIQMEMLKDGPARELVRAESFDKIEQFFGQLLSMLIKSNILKPTDERLILAEYIGPFYYLHMKIISGWLAPDEHDMIINTMRSHLKYFFDTFKNQAQKGNQ